MAAVGIHGDETAQQLLAVAAAGQFPGFRLLGCGFLAAALGEVLRRDGLLARTRDGRGVEREIDQEGGAVPRHLLAAGFLEHVAAHPDHQLRHAEPFSWNMGDQRGREGAVGSVLAVERD